MVETLPDQRSRAGTAGTAGKAGWLKRARLPIARDWRREAAIGTCDMVALLLLQLQPVPWAVRGRREWVVRRSCLDKDLLNEKCFAQ